LGQDGTKKVVAQVKSYCYKSETTESDPLFQRLTDRYGYKLMSAQPHTLTIPEAGKTYFGLSRNAAYAAAKRGDLPTIRIGKLLRVPVRALEQKLNATMKSDA
jgi:hypothetical protein